MPRWRDCVLIWIAFLFSRGFAVRSRLPLGSAGLEDGANDSQMSNADQSLEERVEGCVAPCTTIQRWDLVDFPSEWRQKVLRIRDPKEKCLKGRCPGYMVRLLWVINQMQWAESFGLRAFVDMNETNNPYFGEGRGPNWWEHYYESVTTVDGSSIPEEDVLEMSQGEYPYGAAWELHTRSDSVRTYNYGHGDEKLPESWYGEMRNRSHAMISKYVRVKPHVRDIIDDFTAEHFTSVTLGVHLRGTDKNPEIGGAINGPEQYHEVIKQFKEAHPDGKIFMATDDPKFLKVMKAMYGTDLVTREAQRSAGNVFYSSDGDAYQKGEEVLVDSLLLARSDFIVKPSSAVSEFSMYFNPSLHKRCIDFGMLDAQNKTLDFSAVPPRHTLSVLRGPTEYSPAPCQVSGECLSISASTLTAASVQQVISGKVLRVRPPHAVDLRVEKLVDMLCSVAKQLMVAELVGIPAFVSVDSEFKDSRNMWEVFFQPISQMNYTRLPPDAIVEIAPNSAEALEPMLSTVMKAGSAQSRARVDNAVAKIRLQPVVKSGQEAWHRCLLSVTTDSDSEALDCVQFFGEILAHARTGLAASVAPRMAASLPIPDAGPLGAGFAVTPF